ncbi:MAG: TIGR03905 family TSCPD domain-containing protein [Treponema sp.]|nr:TIGR03905 family TSCPD domain-containing protein [Treponema sp.]
MHQYKTRGTCATEIRFGLQNGKLHSVSFEGGCEGNLKALSILAEGMDAKELVAKLKGLRCGRRTTSCADQLANGIEQVIEQSK